MYLIGWCVVDNTWVRSSKVKVTHLGVYFFTKLPINIVLNLQSGLDILPLGMQNVFLVIIKTISLYRII